MAQINKPSEHFRTKLYTGNGAVRSITFDESENMQPDLMWVKARTTTASWLCNDAVRGATKRLKLDQASAESTETGMITSFDTNGFSLGTTSTSNANGENFVAFNWLAGNTSGSANTDGSITSTVSVNTTAGFSIVSWTGNAVTGATIGHGLGVKPNMIILKNRSPDAASWPIYHSGINGNQSARQYLSLNTTSASTTSSTRWDNEEPNTNTFKTGSSGDVKGDSFGEPFIAYCFAEKTGYSKFGSYKGNGNADGTFVYTGFKPAFIMVKNIIYITDWWIKDSKRPGYNQVNDLLYPNLTNAEEHGGDIDIVSNGFKVRTTATNTNENGDTIIYMAFAEAPLVGTNGVTAKAR